MNRTFTPKDLERLLPARLLDRLADLAGNGHGPLPQLLVRAVELGLEQLAGDGPPANGQADTDGLAARQHAVLECLRNGYSVGEIATILAISETTVRTHISRLKQKTGCADLLTLRLPRPHAQGAGDAADERQGNQGRWKRWQS